MPILRRFVVLRLRSRRLLAALAFFGPGLISALAGNDAGGVGTYLGSWLAHTGHDVTLFEHWTEQVEKISADGIEVSGPHETFVARPRIVHMHSSERIAREAPFEIGFVAVKAYDTKWAASFIDRFVAAGGFIVSAQNCWPDPDIAAAVGAKRAIGLVMSNIAVEMFEAGRVNRPGRQRRRDVGGRCH